MEEAIRRPTATRRKAMVKAFVLVAFATMQLAPTAAWDSIAKWLVP